MYACGVSWFKYICMLAKLPIIHTSALLRCVTWPVRHPLANVMLYTELYASKMLPYVCVCACLQCHSVMFDVSCPACVLAKCSLACLLFSLQLQVTPGLCSLSLLISQGHLSLASFITVCLETDFFKLLFVFFKCPGKAKPCRRCVLMVWSAHAHCFDWVVICNMPLVSTTHMCAFRLTRARTYTTHTHRYKLQHTRTLPPAHGDQNSFSFFLQVQHTFWQSHPSPGFFIQLMQHIFSYITQCFCHDTLYHTYYKLPRGKQYFIHYTQQTLYT